MTPEEKAHAAYGWALEADAKYNYFMAGVATALTGYLGQNLEPVFSAWSPAALEALAVLLFLASAICGLKRLEKFPHLLRVQFQRLWTQSMLFAFQEATRGEKVISHLGTPTSFEETLLAASMTKESLDKAKELEQQVAAVVPRWATARDYLLFAGLAALVASRVWGGYSEPSP